MRKKIIQITLTLNGQQQVFNSDNQNQLTSRELAVSCSLAYGNGAITPTAQIRVYGLPLDKMNKLMRLQWNTMDSLLNTVRIEAGDQGDTLKLVYEGNITQATIDANAAPDIPLIITSQMAAFEKAKVSPPYTLEKDVQMDAALIVEELATGMGYEFNNNGVEHIITDTSLEGSDLEKIQKLAVICDFDLYIDGKKIDICKKGEPRTLKIPVISPSTGLIGYPVPDIKGVNFSCLYDPLVRFGGIVRIQNSQLGDIVNRDWRIYGLTAQLEANIPNGKWQIDAQATWRDSTDVAIGR